MDNKVAENKISKTNTVKCSKVMKTCYYSCLTSGARICNYLGMEGHRRGCPPEECTKYKKKTKKQKHPLKLPKTNQTISTINTSSTERQV